jgi:Ca2+-binding EF-hand superfamily protein
MRDYRITDDNEEIEAIFLTFDADKTDTISYDEFLRAVVGEMSARR